MIFRERQTSLLTMGSNWLEVLIFRNTQTSLLTGVPTDLLDVSCWKERLFPPDSNDAPPYCKCTVVAFRQRHNLANPEDLDIY